MHSPVRVEPTPCAARVGGVSPSMLVTGDDIGVLRSLRAPLGTDGVSQLPAVGYVRAVAFGVDLASARSRREIRRAFRRHMAECVQLCNRLPRLAHLVFVTGAATGAEEAHVLAVGEEFGAAIRALLEQACGVSVAVTIVVADSTEDPFLLVARLAQRTRRTPRINACVALTSTELSQDPRGLAGLNEFL